MVEILTSILLIGLALFLFYWGVKEHQPGYGIIAAFLFLVYGVLILTSGFQYANGQTISYTTLMNNYTANQSNYNATGSFQGSNLNQVFVPVVESETQTLTYGTTKGQFYNDGLGLVFILVGVALGFQGALTYYRRGREED